MTHPETVRFNKGAGYTAPYQYTNLGQIWQGPLNGQGTSQQYLYCDVNHPHQLSGLYPVGTTCANRSGAVYTAGYDAWGNQISRSTGSVTATLSYDALNRLVGYNAGSNGQEWYLSNATGERVLKRSLSGSTTTLTVYTFGLQELGYSGAGAFASQIDYYTLAGHMIGSTNGTTTTYYLTDAQGSVLTTLSASAIVGQQVYGPYGNTRYQVGTMGTTKGYTGQFHDAVSGLDYYHARYYDPVVGQFLSVDEKQGNVQGADPYSYVAGNPETATDPTGLSGVCAWCAETGIAGGSAAASGTYPTFPQCQRGYIQTGTSCSKVGFTWNPSTNPIIGGGGGTKTGVHIIGGQTSTATATTPPDCANLSVSQCNQGKNSKQQDIQNLKNEQQRLKVAIGELTFVADFLTLVKDALTASGVLKVLEILGDLLSVLGDGLTILSQISIIFQWTGAQAFIDWLSTAVNAVGAIYKGIRAALATPWGAFAAGALVVGFYALRTTLFGGSLSLTAPILFALADHVTAGKDNPWKFGALAAGSALQAWWNHDQYQIDLLSNESTSAYCQANPTRC